MSRDDYLRAQRASDPGYDTDRALARAHLDLAAALARRRAESGASVAEVAERSGLPADRVEQIEEGDTTSLTEILRLCHSLRLAVSIDERLRVQTEPGDRAASPAAADGGQLEPAGRTA